MNHKGFTLAELCVCCAVISILAAISTPVFGKIQQTLALRAEIRQLHGNLQHAKIAAIKNNSYVVFKVDDQGYIVFVDDGSGGGTAGDWIRQTQEELLVVKSYDNRVSFEKTTFSANRTRFNGRASGMKAGRVVLKNGNGRKIEVVVSIVGRIRTANI
jgi:type IV fimbrial biogenesis protein FimT